MKKMYKTNTDKKVFGVAAGTANYFGIDVTVSRIAWFLFILITGFFPGLLLYLVLAWILPSESQFEATDVEFEEAQE